MQDKRLETGSVKSVLLSQDVSTRDRIPRDLWSFISNKATTVRFPRPDLFNELWDPMDTMDIKPIQRYVAYLYYSLGESEQSIAFRLGIDRATVTEYRYGIIGKTVKGL